MHWYAWQLIHCYDVIDTNKSVAFLDTDEKVSPVLLQIEAALLNK